MITTLALVRAVRSKSSGTDSGSEQEGTDTSAAQPSTPSGSVVFFGHEDSFLLDVLNPFVESTGVEVNRREFDDEDETETKLRAGFQADVVEICSGEAGSLIEAGLVQPIDTGRIDKWGPSSTPSRKVRTSSTRRGISGSCRSRANPSESCTSRMQPVPSPPRGGARSRRKRARHATAHCATDVRSLGGLRIQLVIQQLHRVVLHRGVGEHVPDLGVLRPGTGARSSNDERDLKTDLDGANPADRGRMADAASSGGSSGPGFPRGHGGMSS